MTLKVVLTTVLYYMIIHSFFTKNVLYTVHCAPLLRRHASQLTHISFTTSQRAEPQKKKIDTATDIFHQIDNKRNTYLICIHRLYSVYMGIVMQKKTFQL